MAAKIHHIAINVSEFEKYVRFFEDVFDMTPEKYSDAQNHRKIWFEQGIQINENADAAITGSQYDHIGLYVDNQEKVMEKAIAFGCIPLPEGSNWFKLPNGIRIEMKG